MTLTELRREGGAAAVRDAIERALAEHPTASDAARALGTDPSTLRRAARRAGVAWPELPPGRAVDVDAYRALTYDPRAWALTPPRRADESPCLWLDDGESVHLVGDVVDVLRCGPVVLCADWCPDGRGRWIVLRADRERDDGEAMAARWKSALQEVSW